MSVRSGALRDKVKIFRHIASATDSRAGGKATTRTEVNAPGRRCSIEPLNGKEYFSSQAQQTKLTHRIRFRYQEGLLQAGDELEDQHVSPTVVYILREMAINPGNERRELVAMCEVRGRSA